MMHTMPQTYCLQEVNGLIHLLLDDLLELLQEPVDPEDRPWVSAVVDYIVLSLRQKFDMETCEGYLAEVTEYRPNWTPQVLRLRAEFVQLLKEIALLRRRVSNCESDAEYSEICKALKSWRYSFRRHQRQGNRMFQEAFLLDVGVGD